MAPMPVLGTVPKVKGIAYIVGKKPRRVIRKKTSGTPPKQAAPRAYRHVILDPDSNYRLKAGMDHGTQNSAICYGYRDDDKPVTHGYDLSTKDMFLAGHSEFRIPSCVGAVEDPDSTTQATCKLVFGDSVKEYETNAIIGDAVIIDLLKMTLVKKEGGFRTGDDTIMLEDVEKRHSALFTRMRELVGDDMKVNVYSELDLPVEVRVITNMADLARLFLKYLLESMQKEVMLKLNLTKEGDFVIREKTDIAVSGCFGSNAEAGYPRSTVLLSEAKDSALFKIVWELTKEGAQMLRSADQQEAATKYLVDYQGKILIIVDVGHGTTDLASIKIKASWPFVVPAEVVLGTGSHCGGYQLNFFFKDLMKQGRAVDLRKIAESRNVTLNDVLESLAQGFENAKRRFKGSQHTYSITYGLSTADGRTTGGVFRITREEMTQIFRRWSNNIISLVQDQIARTCEAGYQSQEMHVALAGGGSYSAFLQQTLKSSLGAQGIEVSQFEPPNHPALAQGNLWALLNKDFCEQKFARVSYGIKVDVPFDQELHADLADEAKLTIDYGPKVRKVLKNRISWGVTKDDDLTNVNGFIGGHIRVYEDFDKMRIRLDVYSSHHPKVAKASDYYHVRTALRQQTITKVGTLKKDLGDYRKRRFVMRHDHKGRPYVDVVLPDRDRTRENALYNDLDHPGWG